MRRSHFASSHLPRLMADIMRTLALLLALGLALLFLSGGISQLYIDWNSFENADLSDLVPSIAEIKAAWDKHGEMLRSEHIPNTLWATFTGLALGVSVGLFLAALMDLSPIFRWILYPILILSQTIPVFAIAVMLILVFGFGFGPKIIVVALFSFYPVTVSTLSGFQSVDHLHTQLLRSMGANALQIWWKIRLPTAMPSFFSGLRIAATYSVVGAVIGEYVGAGNGLGKFLQRSYQSYKADQVFLAITIIAVLSIGLVLFIMLVEILALRWRYLHQSALQRPFTRLIEIIWAGIPRKSDAPKPIHDPKEPLS